MPLGTERDLSPGHIMLDGDPVKVSPHILALLFDLPSALRDNSLSITEHFQTETENASIGGNDKHRSAPLWRFCDFGQI